MFEKYRLAGLEQGEDARENQMVGEAVLEHQTSCIACGTAAKTNESQCSASTNLIL